MLLHFIIFRQPWPVLLWGAGHSIFKTSAEGVTRITLALIAMCVFGSVPVLAVPPEEEGNLERGLVRQVPSLGNRYVLDLWGPTDSTRGDTIYVGPTNSKERAFVWGSDSVMENVAITDDGQTVVVNKHVSSGGDGVVFVRTESGEYRKLLANDYVLERVKSGQVTGLNQSDLPQEQGRNLYCGLGLLPESNALLFTFGRRHLIFYSLEERKITFWQRSLLQYSGWRQDGASHFALRLDELSQKRGVTLCVCETRRDGGDVYERLITFPETRAMVPELDSQSEFRLRTDQVQIIARKTEEVIKERGTVWDVEITGSGPKFETLQGKLSKIRSSVHLDEGEPLQWKTPTTFTALPE